MLDPDARLTLKRGDGSEFPVEFSVRVVDAIDGVAGPALVLALRDVTLRRRRAASLREESERTRARARMHAAEAERARWARELHDETLQSLAALHVLLSSGERAPSPELMRERIALAQGQIEGAMDNLRGLINDLRPAALDELGLAASVHDLAGRVQTVYGIAVETTVALRGSGTARAGSATRSRRPPTGSCRSASPTPRATPARRGSRSRSRSRPSSCACACATTAAASTPPATPPATACARSASASTCSTAS